MSAPADTSAPLLEPPAPSREEKQSSGLVPAPGVAASMQGLALGAARALLAAAAGNPLLTATPDITLIGLKTKPAKAQPPNSRAPSNLVHRQLEHAQIIPCLNRKYYNFSALPLFLFEIFALHGNRHLHVDRNSPPLFLT